MDEYLETRLRLIGGGVQTTLVGIASLQFGALGFGGVLVFVGTAITLGGLV
ncbi:hypothetical protein [Halorussus lipolyticus]|uniref:hypothetical protein n=1 Tax=Halorussus lipolyticus TaxID=3034024 RepID=UPI0023E76CAC|nr:hypothetical protein [Halorussus sp. DT80]